jgi:hypothetical protein
MLKTCPKCGNAFECRNDDILECDCIYVPLNDKEYQFIGERYDDCLCCVCLLKIKTERQCSPKLTAAPK